jgi:hypothetical protein
MSRNYDINTHVQKDGKKLIATSSQDVTGLIQSVKDLKHLDGGKKELGYHAARIPMLLLYKWGAEDANDQFAYVRGRHNREPELAKKLSIRLNSNEFHQFRIWEGNVAASDMLKEGNKLNANTSGTKNSN